MDPIEVLTNLEKTARAEAAAGHIVPAPAVWSALADFAAWMKENALVREFPDEEPTKPGGGDEQASATPA